MVSVDTGIIGSHAKSIRKRSLICSGDHHCLSHVSTWVTSGG